MVLTLQSLQRSFSTQVMELVERKRQEKQKEQEDNMTEITNLLHGDLLSENPQQAASSFGPHRVVPDRWKGMSKEQLEEIRFTQKQQIQEKLVSSSWATEPPLHPQAAPHPAPVSVLILRDASAVGSFHSGGRGLRAKNYGHT